MIEEGAQKEILTDNYEQYRERADTCREQGDAEAAARYYRKCADVLERIADLETSDQLATRREELAQNLRTAARQLEETGSINQTTDDSGDSEDEEPGTPQPPSVQDQSSGHSGDDDAPNASQFLSEPPDLDFRDVGGMTELKDTLRDVIIDPLERPDLYEEYDLGVVNGVLLYGPPGTGKTYITRALAGELDYNFVSVDPTDITSSLVGEAAENVSNLFDVARDNQPCLVFIDEIDALMPARSGGSQKTQSERQMVNQFLTELTNTRGEDVITVGATNLPDEVDDAAVSRFQKRIEVPPPDGTARAAILRVHLRNRPVLHEQIDWEQVKDQTEGYSGRDLELVATNAARNALQEAQEQDDLQPITQSHLKAAIEETESSLTDINYDSAV